MIDLSKWRLKEFPVSYFEEDELEDELGKIEILVYGVLPLGSVNMVVYRAIKHIGQSYPFPVDMLPMDEFCTTYKNFDEEV